MQKPLLIRGDHELNEIKAEKLPEVASPFEFADEAVIKAKIGAGVGSLGPVNLNIPVIIDRSVALVSDFSAGANIDGKHYFNINWERDVALPKVADIRNVVEGDPSPDGKGTLLIKRGIEVGHKSESVQEYAEELYRTLQAQGVEVIFDDRKERPGVMFADMELIGVPHMVVIGEKNLANGEIEYKNRRTGEKQMIAKDQLLDFLKGQIKA